MKKFLLIVILIAAYFQFSGAHSPLPYQTSDISSSFETAAHDGDQAIANAFERHISNLQVEGQGIVSKVLADDLDGSRHQRFIVRLATGQILLVAHNIDLAPRIDGLSQGDQITFFGEYEWNPKGGVIHWTHHDPAGRHEAGWIKHNGSIYQ